MTTPGQPAATHHHDHAAASPVLQSRLEAIRDYLTDRIAEAERDGRAGEAAVLQSILGTVGRQLARHGRTPAQTAAAEAAGSKEETR